MMQYPFSIIIVATFLHVYDRASHLINWTVKLSDRTFGAGADARTWRGKSRWAHGANAIVGAAVAHHSLA